MTEEKIARERKPSLLFILVCALIGIALGGLISWSIFGNPLASSILTYFWGTVFGVLVGWEAWGRRDD